MSGSKKDKKKDQTNLAKSKEEMNNICAMFFRMQLGWKSKRMVDSGASCHVCVNKELFTSYTPSSQYEKLFMANSVAAKAEAGKVHLKMTLDKAVT